ncbi:hypothetical protein HED60_14400 [Planctomycetales bacterium ZRK34]|nr:hypothetical protein HED60_14400 [Planctomycetales bacterium ZRK34]
MYHSFGVCVVVLFTCLTAFVGRAEALVVSQTIPIPADTLVGPTGTSTGPIDLPIITPFTRFDATLGTLTRIDYTYQYDLLIIVTPGSGSGPISAGATGTFEVVGQSFDGNGNGDGVDATPGQSYMIPFSVAGSNNLIPGSDSPVVIAAFTGAGPGETEDWVWNTEVRGNIDSATGATVQLDLLDTSSLTIEYTYDPIPEPAAALTLLTLLPLLHRRNPT